MNKTYEIKGKYKQGSEQGKFEGTVSINEKGVITGTIVDKLSESSIRKIHGRVVKRDGFVHLDFLINVLQENLLNIHYSLAKKEQFSLNGEYFGSWTPVEKELSRRITGKYEAFNGEDVYIQEIQTLVPRKKDKILQEATVVLYEKSDN